MRIAYIGRVTLAKLVGTQAFDRAFPSVRWGFPLGSDIVNGLVARGHEVDVVTEHTVAQIERFSAGRLTVWLVPCWPRSVLSYASLFYREVRGFRRCLDEIAPEVVFAQWTYYNAYAGLTSGYSTLVVAHDSPWRIFWITHSLQSFIRAFYAHLLVFHRIDHLTTVSPYIVGELRRFNRYRGEILVVPNGTRIEAGRGASIRREAKIITCVSQWDRRKNVKVLLRAFAMLRTDHPDWTLVTFGAGLDERTAGDWMRRNGVSCEGVALRGLADREEIDRVLREDADVFCSPTLEESFGMVFVEAMRQGVPCVGGINSGAVAWVMGEGGVACDVSVPDTLAACLEGVMLDWELRMRLSAAGVKRVKEHFDIEQVVDSYERELVRIVTEGK